jgi:hypothetical protein
MQLGCLEELVLGVEVRLHEAGPLWKEKIFLFVNTLRNSTNWRECRVRPRTRYGNRAFRNNRARRGFAASTRP